MTSALLPTNKSATVHPMKIPAAEIAHLRDATSRVREFADAWRRAVSNMSAVSFVHISGVKLTIQDLEDALTYMDNKNAEVIPMVSRAPGVTTDHLVNAPADNTKVKLLYAYYINDDEKGLTDSLVAYFAEVLDKGYTSRCSELRKGGLIEQVSRSKTERKALCRITERGKNVIRQRESRLSDQSLDLRGSRAGEESQAVDASVAN